MKIAKQNKRIIRFGAFEADLRNFELRKYGLRLKLQEQPFHILAQLLGRPGEIVSREELRTILWPEDTFVEFDHGINTAMQKVRAALSDSARNPRFIETLPRRGYRFVAPVQFLAGQPLPQSQNPRTPAQSHTMARLAGLLERGLSVLNGGRPRSRIKPSAGAPQGLASPAGEQKVIRSDVGA